MLYADDVLWLVSQISWPCYPCIKIQDLVGATRPRSKKSMHQGKTKDLYVKQRVSTLSFKTQGRVSRLDFQPQWSSHVFSPSGQENVAMRIAIAITALRMIH
jgi:hypothetical protein